MLVSEIIENIKKNKKDLEFLKTGFENIDKDLDGGFLRKELIVLGGQTGVGKSFLAGQLFWNIAKQGYISSYYSLEISNEMLVSRLIGNIANIKPSRIYGGWLTEEENNKRIEAEAELLLNKEFLYLYDNIYKLSDIEATIKETKPEFIVIDFIQNVIYNAQTEYERLSFVALELQRLAKEVNCCILVLSQLSNSIARDNINSSIVEYKGAGTIAQVCDLGFFIEQAGDRSLTMALRKNRRGISKLYFHLGMTEPGGLFYEK